MAPEIANPAVIIGLGGTGQWVLTYIKKNLLDSYDGRVPPTVRLLSFDTIDKSSQKQDDKEEFVHVGDVQLSDTEYHYIGGNIENLCREIKDRALHPHIASWLQARYYLSSKEPGAFDISKGAGQERPFGRMAIFHDLQTSIENKVASRIKSAITDVVSANGREAPVELYIVASLAGGTGAGMFIDIAHLTRWFARRSISDGRFFVRGFLALHNTFNSVIHVDQVKANAFAAMRELDRFMLVFDRQYPIVYNQINPELTTIYGGQLGKLFDTCYLIDARRDNLPLDGIKPQQGVYPSMADGITMHLDAKAGDKYAEHHLNVASRISRETAEQKMPFYSTFGTYTLILPVEDMLESMTYRFALELLSQHLTRTETLPNGQIALHYPGNPKNDVSEFLRMSQSRSGLESTNFIQRVPNTLERRNVNSELYQQEIGELDTNELITWLQPPDSDPLVEQAAREVRNTLETRLMTKVAPTSEYGDDYIAGADRIIAGVREFKDEYLGRDSNGMRRGGRYRKGLERYVSIHRERYRLLLREYVLDTLNGIDVRNPLYQESRRGKLGHVQEFLRILSNYFTDLSSFFGDVKRFREKKGMLRESQELANLSRSEMEDNKTAGGFLATFNKQWGEADKSQKRYLQDEQDLIDMQIMELLFDYLRAAADHLREETEELKASVDSWVQTLILGTTGTLDDPGTFKLLQQQQRQHANNRAGKDAIRVHRYVTDAPYEDKLYATYTYGKFDDAMARLEWSFDQKDPLAPLRLSGLTPLGSDTASARQATAQNVQSLLELGHSYMLQVRHLSIAQRLEATMGAPGVVSLLLSNCSPMVRYDPSRQGKQEGYNFICINSSGHDQFARELANDLRTRGSSARSNQLIEQTNPYTCTIFSTLEVLASSGLMPYTEAERAYNQHRGDSRLLHVYPAEVNAVEYEQKLPEIREERRRFSPTLTTMLEDRAVVDEFVLSYIYGLIQLVNEGRESRYVLELAPQEHWDDVARFNLTAPSRQSSLFEAMETFVFKRADINDSSPLPIDLARVGANLHDFESRRASGDPGELITILRKALRTDIDPLRGDSDQALRDLGSLMALIVRDIVKSLEEQQKRGLKLQDRRLEPSLFSMSPTVEVPASSDHPVVMAQPAEAEDRDVVVEAKLKELLARAERFKKLLKNGAIEQQEYDDLIETISAERRQLLAL